MNASRQHSEAELEMIDARLLVAVDREHHPVHASHPRLLGVDDLFDPEANVAAGVKYLKYLFGRFNDPRVALAAYNAGEGNVERFGGVPPFPETIQYIGKVNARARAYRSRVQESYLLSTRAQLAYTH